MKLVCEAEGIENAPNPVSIAELNLEDQAHAPAEKRQLAQEMALGDE